MKRVWQLLDFYSEYHTIRNFLLIAQPNISIYIYSYNEIRYFVYRLHDRICYKIYKYYPVKSNIKNIPIITIIPLDPR